jgi:hypothetical protein
MRVPAALPISLAAVAVLGLAAVPASAKPKPPAPNARLECRSVATNGTTVRARYQTNAKAGMTTFMATMEVPQGAWGADPGDPAPGDEVPVTVGTVQVGGFTLAQDGTALEGALRFDRKAKGHVTSPFPADFPFDAMVAGTVVQIGAQTCSLQSRGHG